MFADDTNIATSGKSVTKLIQFINSDLRNVSEWLLSNKLSLNVTKTEQIFIASEDNLNKISDTAVIILGSKKLKRVRESKSLGVYVGEKLS